MKALSGLLLGTAGLLLLLAAWTQGAALAQPLLLLCALFTALLEASARPRFGPLPWSLWVGLLWLARPEGLGPGGGVAGLGEPLGRVSEALLLVALGGAGGQALGAVAGRTQPGEPGQGAAELPLRAVHLLRLASVGLLFLQFPGVVEVGPGGQPQVELLGRACLGALALGGLLGWCFDRLLAGVVVYLGEGEAVYRGWLESHQRSGWPAALVPLFSAQLGLWAVGAGLARWGEGADLEALGLGLAAGAVPMLLLAWGVALSASDLELADRERMEDLIRSQQLQLEGLKDLEGRLGEEVQEQREQLKLLDEFARDLGAAADLDGIFAIVLQVLGRVGIPFDSAVLFTLTEGRLEPARWSTPHEKVLGMEGLLGLEERLARKAAASGWVEWSAELREGEPGRIFPGERSVMCAPLIVSKKPIGVLYLGSEAPGTHDESMKAALIKVAAHAAPSIHTARLLLDKEQDLVRERERREREEAKNRVLRGLQEMVVEIGRSMRLDHSLEVVARGLKELLPEAQSVVLFLAEGGEGAEEQPAPEFEARTFTCQRVISPYDAALAREVIRPGDGLVGVAMLHKRFLPVDDTREYSHPNLVLRERSAIAAPLISEEEVLGCLYVGAAEPGRFDQEAQLLVRALASQAALAIRNARLMDDLERLSFTDGLTGLFSHRYFKEQLKLEVEWARRTGKPLALVLVDTDKFKQFNDTLGHPAGDALLIQIADILKGHVRATDLVCRQGGDEFAVIMKESPKAKAVEVAERIREAFSLRFSQHRVQVTASIGVAGFPSDAETSAELAELADQALYRSKREGRNRVSAAPPRRGPAGLSPAP